MTGIDSGIYSPPSGATQWLIASDKDAGTLSDFVEIKRMSVLLYTYNRIRREKVARRSRVS